MEIREDFKEIIAEIRDNSKEFKITVRDFLGYFHCYKRTKGNKARIDKILSDHNLETVPDYGTVWIDGEIVLKHKAKAKSKLSADPVQRISLLPSANKPPITINRDAKLNEAMTLMMLHDFSQLPVMSNPRSIAGVITWETIGYGLSKDSPSEQVKDYIDPNVTVVDLEKPLLEAIQEVISNEFVLVQKKDKTLTGIVTLADISSQFLTLTEPFLLLEQIENLIRLLLDDRFLVDDLKEFSAQEGLEHELEYIDDMTFGQYVRLLQKPANWEKLNLKIDRAPFIKQLDAVREIRNDIMHFDPEGITNDQRQALKSMAKFLTELIKHV